MKKHNFGRILWVTSLFLLLIEILFMVMDYKINYQYLTKNELYFYECDGTLCVTEVEEDKHLLYSTYECGYNDCPIFKSELNDTYVILTKKNTNILYNYRTGKTISDNYDDYMPLIDDYLIVTKNNKQGIINTNNKIIASLDYQELGIMKEDNFLGYNENYIIAKQNDKYGIISIRSGTQVEPFEHKEEDLESLLNLLKNNNLLL